MHVLQITTNRYAIHSPSKKELVCAGKDKNACNSYCAVATVANGTDGPTPQHCTAAACQIHAYKITAGPKSKATWQSLMVLPSTRRRIATATTDVLHRRGGNLQNSQLSLYSQPVEELLIKHS